MAKGGTVGCKRLELDSCPNRPFQQQTFIRGNSQDHSTPSVTAGFRSFGLALGHTFPIGRFYGRSVDQIAKTQRLSSSLTTVGDNCLSVPPFRRGEERSLGRIRAARNHELAVGTREP